jgi:asparagine synthase (glutamine-hydrolysing)
MGAAEHAAVAQACEGFALSPFIPKKVHLREVMPGIVGLITKMPREWAEPQLTRMIESLRHESFYVSGTFVDESIGVYAGWVARKGSFSDGMPLRNEQGDVTLVFSGEDYADPQAIECLKRKGHSFSAGGSSYLVHQYEEDDAFPSGLNGRFHGLVADTVKQTATLFNDRYGMHRLYYDEAKEAFYFAAEAKAILTVRPELRKIDFRGMGEFVSTGCVMEDRSLFEGINVLPIASAWTFRAGEIERKDAYFHPREWEEQDPLDEETYYQQVREAFSRNLPRYFAGQERVAMSLTGGLDTRMILAWLKPAAGSLPCYTFGGTYRECRDVIIARKVARDCGQSHQVIRADSAFLSQFARYAERTVYLTDACVEVGRSPVLFANEQAREIAPVRMTGNWGDQILRWLRVFRPGDLNPGIFEPGFNANITAAKSTFSGITQTHPLSFVAFRQAPWYFYGLLSLEESQLALRSPYMDNDLVKTCFRAPKSTLGNNDLRVRLIGDGSPGLRKMRTDLGFGGDPSLYGDFLQWFHLFTMKAEYAYDHGMPQKLARVDHMLSPLHLERLFLGRHKYYHFRVWYRDALASYVREMLLDSRTLSRPYLNRHGVETVVNGHLKNGLNYTFEIHTLLTLELLHRRFVDPQ